jgi:hypothetical protein
MRLVMGEANGITILIPLERRGLPVSRLSDDQLLITTSCPGLDIDRAEPDLTAMLIRHHDSSIQRRQHFHLFPYRTEPFVYRYDQPGRIREAFP